MREKEEEQKDGMRKERDRRKTKDAVEWGKSEGKGEQKASDRKEER